MPEPLRIASWTADSEYDNDDPNYRPANPATYFLLALCYDVMGGPSVRVAGDGVAEPDFEAMKPRLAEAFGEEEDGSWWVRLRAGLNSHAGHELTAEGVKWTFDKIFAAKQIGSYRWTQIVGVVGVEVVDRYTLRFRLRAPNPHFPAYLFFATPNIVDAEEVRLHATEADPWGVEWLQKGHVSGFGAFSLVDVDTERMRFRSRPDYWSGEVPVPEAWVERVDSRAEALELLNSSAPVYLAGLRPDEVVALRESDDVNLLSCWAGHTSLEINYHRPPFDDVRVRHALSYATPYEQVIEHGLLGLARPWRGPIKTFTTWYTDEYWDYHTNLETARQLLREAGYGDGFTTVLYLSQRPELIRIGDILQTAYRQIGIEVELRNLDTAPAAWMPALHLRTECSHNLSEPLYDLAHDYAPFNPILPNPGGPLGVGTWTPRYAGDRRLEDMYRDILVAPTKDERRQRCLDLQKAIVEFAPTIFLAEGQHVNAGNRQAPEWTRDFDSHFVQLLMFQNSNSNYLPRLG